MSSLLRPVGPKSAAVYWRRRLVLLAFVAAVVVLVGVLLAQPWAGNAEPHPAGAAIVTSTTAPPPATEQPAAVAPQVTPSQPTAPAPSAQAAAPPACGPADVRVRAVTDSNSYSAGQHPQLSFTLTNTSSTPCVINAGTTKQAFTITSGSDVYWRSSDCQSGAADTLALLPPGQEIPSAVISWDRTRSAPDTCSTERPPVPAGGASFHLKVTVDGRESAETKQFLLY